MNGRRSKRKIRFGGLMLLVGFALTSCSGGGSDSASLAEVTAEDEVAAPVDSGPEVPLSTTLASDAALPDGQLLDGDTQLAANAYKHYIELQNRGEVTQAEADAIAAGIALDALLFSAGEGVEGDGSVTEVGIISASFTGSTVMLDTCDVADLGPNTVADDGSRVTDYRVHQVTVETASGEPVVTQVTRVTSALSQGRFCAPADVQQALIAQVLDGFTAYGEVAAGDAEVGVLDELFEDPIRSFLKERLESAPGRLVGPIELRSGQVTNFIPNFRGQVALCLVYPEGLSIYGADDELLDQEPAGSELGLLASVAKPEPGEGDFEIVDIDFAPTTPIC